MHKLAALLDRYPRWLALIAGGVSATGFAPLNLWLLTLLCLALLMHLVARSATGKRAFQIGWLFGLGHFTIGNNWIATAFTYQANMPAWLGWLAVPLLALYLAVYPGLAALGAWWLANVPPRNGEGDHPQDGGGARAESHDIESSRDSAGAPPPAALVPVEPLGPVRGTGPSTPVPGRMSLAFILAFAGYWIITEWLRSWVFTGFAWNPLGVVAVDVAWFAVGVGTYGIAALVIIASGAISLLVARRWKAAIGVAAFSAALGIWGWVIFLSNSMPSYVPKTPQITIVQPNISQIDKYRPGYEALNFTRLAQNSRPKTNQPRLLLWPEAAIPWWLEDGYPPQAYWGQPGDSAAGSRVALAQLLGPDDVLLTGADRLTFKPYGRLSGAYNSVLAIDAKGVLRGSYAKAHLVPYGEYLALRWLLEPLGAARLVPGDIDFLPGPGPRTMTVNVGGKPVKVGMQICYEMIFSGQVVDRAHRPDFIFNPSNDAWFGSWGPPQHLAQARLRAIEEGLPVVRSTPTGISAIIDADGRIIESLPLGKAGRIDATLPFPKSPTLFARYGNVLPLGFAALLIALALLPLARRRTSR